MTKAHSYLRVSGKGQVDGDGFPRQRAVIEAYCQAHNIIIEREFVEQGVSGTLDAFDRPALTDLMVAIKANGVRLVLVERADRLARDLMISEILLSEFRKLGVKVIAADSDTDLSVEDKDPTRTLVRQMLGAIAQFEKSCIVQKLRAARARARRDNGRCEGRKPYGSKPGEHGVFDYMKELRAEGKSFKAIAQILNEKNIPTRVRDAAWHPTTLARILGRG